MTSIAVLGDLHGNRRRLDAVLSRLAARRPDLALLTGDLGLDPPWAEPARQRERAGHDASVREMVSAVGSVLACPVAYVPGNHDLRDACPVEGATNVDRRIVEFDGLVVAGLGGAGPARFGFPYEWDEEEAEAALGAFPGPTERWIDVLLCHTPPAGTTLDRTLHGEHVGSAAVRAELARVRPRLFVCGHIHEAAGIETLDDVVCLNAGALGEPYGAERAWIVEWSVGPRKIDELS